MGKIDRKTHRWVCHSLNVICWGNQNDKQRFKCKECGVELATTQQLIKCDCLNINTLQGK